tara:strand:+ start:115 stop:744 length:630 start_codon:yes stop_codon:yes gene_type:complete
MEILLLGIVVLIILYVIYQKMFGVPTYTSSMSSYKKQAMSSFMGQAEKIQNHLIKKLMAYAMLHSSATYVSEIRREGNIKTQLDAEKFADLTFKASNKNIIMGTPEATIAVISECYRIEVSNNNRSTEEALKIMDKQRFTSTTKKLARNELSLENYIIAEIKRLDTRNVFPELDKQVLKDQIKIAEDYMDDHEERYKAIEDDFYSDDEG